MLRDIVLGVKAQVSEQVLNQENMTELALAAFFAGGHMLLTGPTGLGKTDWAQAIAQALGLTCSNKRHNDELEYNKEPLFSQVFVADAVKTVGHQDSLIELVDMQAQYADSKCYALPEPFFMIATHDGAQTLSEALNDRFMIKLPMNYPGIVAEKLLLQRHHSGNATRQKLLPVCNLEAIAQAKAEVQAVAVEDGIFNYIISIVETTRRVGAVATGASPRGSIALLMAAKAWAAIQGRDYVVAEDVRSLALPVLRHRIKLKPDAVQEGVQPDQIIEGILAGRRTA